MRLDTTATVHAPPDEVWRWWTDYGEPGTESDVTHGLGRTHRRVAERDGNRIVLVEEMPLPLKRRPTILRHEVRLDEAARRIREAGTQPMRFDSEWTFTPENGGAATRIRRVLHVHSRAADAVAPVAAPLARRFAERDLRHHVEEFERERAPGP